MPSPKTHQSTLLYEGDLNLSGLPELGVQDDASTQAAYDLFSKSNSELGEDAMDYPMFFHDLDYSLSQKAPELRELHGAYAVEDANGGGSHSSCCAAEETDWEPLIAQLALFSTSISQLRYAFRKAFQSYKAHRSSIANNGQLEKCSLGEAVLRSVTLWLANGPAIEMRPSLHFSPQTLNVDVHHQTLGELLYRLFSASHYSTEIVQNVVSEATTDHNVRTRLDQQPSLLDMAIPQFYSGRSPSSESESHHRSSSIAHSAISTNSIVLHLLIANHDGQHRSVSSQTSLPMKSPGTLSSTGDVLSEENIMSMFNEIKHEIMLLQLRIDT
ncbi:hypothetical protein PWT90_00290 [Aphanocladium album]|nr:hypothetical protein PWT90_00290 [Aphanocladium album]